MSSTERAVRKYKAEDVAPAETADHAGPEPLGTADHNLVEIIRDYYDSSDADNFYFEIWGGEHIHVGIYEGSDTSIGEASRRTVKELAARLPHLGPNHRVLDLGAGYGGAARYLAKTFGCRVVTLNVSSTENERCRALCQTAGVAHLVEVTEGSYEKIPERSASFDVVWSQDAILHSGRKDRVFNEVARILRPGGHFVLTDPMESGNGSRDELAPVLARIHLTSMGSFTYYTELAGRVGLEQEATVDLSSQLVTHYSKVRKELNSRKEELSSRISTEFIERMLVGLDHWVSAGKSGSLAWGIMHFRKC